MRFPRCMTTRDDASFHVLPGAAGSPVLLHVPHSSRALPPEVRRGILLDDEALERELDLLTDAHTAELAARAAGLARERPWRFVNRLSRLAVDPERFPDEREEMLAAGMGAVYTRTAHGRPLRAGDFDPRGLLGRYFAPYARAVAEAVDDRLAATGRAVVIDVHSYPSAPLPYELHGDGPGRPSASVRTPSTHRRGCGRRRAGRSTASAERASTARSPGRTCRWSTTGGTGGSPP